MTTRDPSSARLRAHRLTKRPFRTADRSPRIGCLPSTRRAAYGPCPLGKLRNTRTHPLSPRASRPSIGRIKVGGKERDLTSWPTIVLQSMSASSGVTSESARDQTSHPPPHRQSRRRPRGRSNGMNGRPQLGTRKEAGNDRNWVEGDTQPIRLRRASGALDRGCTGVNDPKSRFIPRRKASGADCARPRKLRAPRWFSTRR